MNIWLFFKQSSYLPEDLILFLSCFLMCTKGSSTLAVLCQLSQHWSHCSMNRCFKYCTKWACPKSSAVSNSLVESRELQVLFCSCFLTKLCFSSGYPKSHMWGCAHTHAHTHMCVVMRDMRGEFTPHFTSERLMLLTYCCSLWVCLNNDSYCACLDHT